MSEIESLETQSARMVPIGDCLSWELPYGETKTAVETSGRSVRQVARQLDITPTCCRCRRHDSCTKSQLKEVTDLVVDGKEARRRVDSGSRVERERSSRSAASSFCPLPSPEAIARNQLQPALLSTLIFISRDSHPISSPASASACHDAPARPSIQFAAGGGSSPRIDGPV